MTDYDWKHFLVCSGLMTATVDKRRNNNKLQLNREMISCHTFKTN